MPERSSSSFNGAVEANCRSAATIFPLSTLPLCRAIAICRGISWRKSSSRENTSLIGVPRIWFAISARTRVLVLETVPETSAGPLIVKGDLFRLEADRRCRDRLHELRTLMADPDFHPRVGDDADPIERFQGLMCHIGCAILRLD